MSSPQILVVEDDPHIRTGLQDILESEHYTVTAVSNGREALATHHADRFALILLDIMMPEVSGYDVCREIRRRDPQVPIIMLTAKGQELDKVIGLDLGADDYITKPFGVRELLARIAAVLRRAQRAATADDALPDHFAFGPATIYRRTYRGQLGDRQFALTAIEMELLETFHAHPHEVLTRDELMRLVWGQQYFGTTRTLDQHVAQLRKKIEPNPQHPVVLTTAHGIGYRYEGETAGQPA
jgi:DNA-binding response OmpR family regulator